MSIASEITALTADRNAIRTALVNQGVTAASTHGFDDFATDIASISAGGSIEITETLDSHGGTILNITTEGELDLSNDTVAADKLLSGYTAHDASGASITGSLVFPEIPVIEKDVNLIDYDGTLLYSYTAEEFAELIEFPPNPSHPGLTAQGWNWNIGAAKAYVSTHGKLVVGQHYVTDDGKTRLYVTFNESSDLDIRLYFAINGQVIVDWGDNSQTQTMNGTSITTSYYTNDHTYPSAGSYIITLTVTSGELSFYCYSTSYSTFAHASTDYNSTAVSYVQGIKNTLKKIEFGTGVVRIGTYAFYQFYNLETVTVPNTLTQISQSAFFKCVSLKAFVLADSGSTSNSISSNAFQYCYNLVAFAFPKSLSSVSSSAFDACSRLRLISIPENVALYQYSFRSTGIEELIIPTGAYLSSSGVFEYSGVTSVKMYASTISSQAFMGCNSLRTAIMQTTTITNASNAFQDCSALESVTLPNNATQIPSGMFSGASSIRNVIIPSTVTTISSTAFGSTYGLVSVTIPNNVTSIGTNAFQYCYGLREIHFMRTTPPTLGGSSTFSGMPSSCKIYVPTGSLSAYTSATNYPSSSTYTYIEE